MGDTVGLAAGFAQRMLRAFACELQMAMDDRNDYLARRLHLLPPAAGDERRGAERGGARREMSERDWVEPSLAHTDKTAAFKRLSDFALDERLYWSGRGADADHPENHQCLLDCRDLQNRASEGITELFW